MSTPEYKELFGESGFELQEIVALGPRISFGPKRVPGAKGGVLNDSNLVNRRTAS